jgi:hypothetical protein
MEELNLDDKEDTESEEKNDDLSNLLKSFNKIDNYVAKYIYEKYIKNKSEKGCKKGCENSNDEAYKTYLHTIFSLERPAIITQKESLETDLQNMEIADEAYKKDPIKFKVRQYDSLPDIKRCSFIRKHNNKYKRCANGILNNDSDMCYKHIDSLNMYWNSYCKIME